LAAGEWVSDDLVSRDFRVSLYDRVDNYMPTRTSILWRRPALYGELAADYLLVLDNAYRQKSVYDGTGALVRQSNIWDFSNLLGRERGISHRGPALRLGLLPTTLAPGLTVDAEVAASRYGAWTAARRPEAVVAGATGGVALRRPFGPVSVDARAGVDALWLDPTGPSSQSTLMTRVDAGASLRLARAYGDLVHVIRPEVRWRYVPWETRALYDLPAIDARFERGELHQVLGRLEQTFWRHHPGGSDRIGALSLTQPLAIDDGELLPSRIDVQAVLAPWVNLLAWSDLDLTRAFALEEVGGEATGALGPLTFNAGYARWTARAERFRRTLYELAAQGRILDDTAYLHLVRGSVGVHAGERLYAAYSTAYLLPVPAAAVTRTEGFTHHVLSATYRSPCECWEAGVTVSVPAREPLEGLRAQINLAIGGYSLGN
jgi:hypothetical protein